MDFFTAVPSPLGVLRLTSDGEALTGLYLQSQDFGTAAMIQQDGLPLFEAVRDWLDGYFVGAPGEITFPLSPVGTPFQRRVWELLLTIPYGKTTTYGSLAKKLGPKMSAQAVGQAVGKNPIAIIIPCHRVLGAKGQLSGYAGGLENKQRLLDHEGISYLK